MPIEQTRERERKWQEEWAKARLFESNPDEREKFFCTFPYPYVNGLPHVGHLFTMMRVEALARYKRLRGKNVLFPQGFHATGSPIASAANRVKEGDEKQIRILLDLGVPQEEVHRFSVPEHWIEYFVPRYRDDLASTGMCIDWRRTFHTTSLNPQYDAFIRWQFLRLKELGYVVQGSHPVVWCPKDEAPVGDHDRSVGEGETPQEFLLVKHRLPDGSFIVSATLRPDTILGVTNLYVNPKTSYVKARVDGETWILGEAAARRLSAQGHEVEVTGKIAGKDLIGREVEEFAGHKVIVLPATFLDANFGTGLVHSVPSDSADDLIALRDLQGDEAELKSYGLDPKKVRAIGPIEVLDTPGIGGNPAQHYLERYGVKHQKERKKLDEIKQELYKASYYSATFNEKYERFGLSGVRVQEGKERIQQAIVDAGWATTYHQLTGRVVCRCQTEAIVKIVSDQWFIAYDDAGWKAQVDKALSGLKLYPEKARPQFEYVIGWLKQWACTREYGLGTRLPWDERWLIESLSDSTIYMAYYAIAHLVKDVPAQDLTPEFFDWVFLGKGERPKVKGAQRMRDEFLYWYPLDFRNSGKDLVQNHLTFMLFNHCAVFEQAHWPRGIGVNGWVTVNGQKMSKSLGNVIPVRDLVGEYGADATRITILNGGEGMDDPNWDSDFARGVTGKLDSLIRQAGEAKNLSGDETGVDAWLRSRMNELVRDVTMAMEETNFRTAIQLAFFEYSAMLRWYAQRTMGRPCGDLYREALGNQIVMCSPFVPHACEEAWRAIGEEGFVSAAPWPRVDAEAIDERLERAEAMVRDVADAMRRLRKPAKAVRLHLAADWKREAYAAFDGIVARTRNPSEIMKEMSLTPLKEHADELSRLVQFLVKGRAPGYVPSREEEGRWLRGAKEYLEGEAGCPMEVLDAGASDSPRAHAGLPGKPAVEFS